MWNLVPLPGIDPVRAWGAQSLTKEVPGDLSLKIKHNFIFGQGVDFPDFTYMESRFAEELEEDPVGAEGKGTMGVCRSESHLTFIPMHIDIHMPGRKAMASLDSILKSRDIILPTNVHLVKAVVFPVVMYGCESWIIKKAEY